MGQRWAVDGRLPNRSQRPSLAVVFIGSRKSFGVPTTVLPQTFGKNLVEGKGIVLIGSLVNFSGV